MHVQLASIPPLAAAIAGGRRPSAADGKASPIPWGWLRVSARAAGAAAGWPCLQAHAHPRQQRIEY